MSTISLDYDGTYTADPELWLQFVRNARFKGHTVYVVTMRTPQEAKDIDQRLVEMCQIITTSRLGKSKFVRMLGIKIDIWIDDNPGWIFDDSN